MLCSRSQTPQQVCMLICALSVSLLLTLPRLRRYDSSHLSGFTQNPQILCLFFLNGAAPFTPLRLFSIHWVYWHMGAPLWLHIRDENKPPDVACTEGRMHWAPLGGAPQQHVVPKSWTSPLSSWSLTSWTSQKTCTLFFRESNAKFTAPTNWCSEQGNGMSTAVGVCDGTWVVFFSVPAAVTRTLVLKSLALRKKAHPLLLKALGPCKCWCVKCVLYVWTHVCNPRCVCVSHLCDLWVGALAVDTIVL